MEKERRTLEEELKKEQIEQRKELERALKESKVLKDEDIQAMIEQKLQYEEQAHKQYKENFSRIKKENIPSWSLVIPNSPVEPFEPYTAIGTYFGNSRESTSLNIHKDVKELTFSTKFKYEVQEGSQSFRFSASGSVDQGTIQIKLINPAEKVIHEFEVSPLADVEWSQGFRWSEEEADDNYGSWTIVVSAKNATGSYQVTVRAI